MSTCWEECDPEDDYLFSYFPEENIDDYCKVCGINVIIVGSMTRNGEEICPNCASGFNGGRK